MKLVIARSVLCAALLSFVCVPALAGDPETKPTINVAPGVSEPAPDIKPFPFIQTLLSTGASLYYLGNKFGFDGWFTIRDKQLQVFYTQKDTHSLVIGTLLTADGKNISQQQLAKLSESDPVIKSFLGDAGEPATMPATVEMGNLPGIGLTRSNPPLPSIDIKLSNEEQIFNDLQRATRITFAKKPGLPKLYMVLDVNDETCKQVWKDLQPYVEAGRLQIVLIPMTFSGSQSETDAANWVTKKDPYEAWLRHLAGEKDIIRTGPISTTTEDIINATTQLMVWRWNIKKYPYLTYHTKDGHIVGTSQAPRNIELFLSNISTEIQ